MTEVRTRQTLGRHLLQYAAGVLTALISGSYVISGAGEFGTGLVVGIAVLLLGVVVAPLHRISGPNYFDGLVIALFVVAIGSLLRDHGSRLEILATFQFIGLGLLPYCLIRIAGASEQFFSGFHVGMMLVGLALLVVVSTATTGIGGAYGKRLGSEALNPNGVGLVAAYVVITAAYHILVSGGARIAVFSALGIMVGVTAITMTAGRGAFLSVAISLVILFLYSATRLRTFFVLLGVVLGVFVAGRIGAVTGVLSELVGPESVFFVRVISLNDFGSVYERQALYAQSLESFLEHALTGMGLTGFQEQTGNYPHNLFLDLMVSFGLFGALASVVILFFTLHSFLRGWQIRMRKEVGLFIALFAMGLIYRQSSLSLIAIKDLLVFAAVLINIFAAGAGRGIRGSIPHG